MDAHELLMILVVGESGLRSMLSARLALAGLDVITAKHFDDPQLQRMGSASRVLVTDQGATADYPGGAETLSRDPQWAHVVEIGGDVLVHDDRLIRIPRSEPAAAITALARQWGGERLVLLREEAGSEGDPQRF